MKLRLFLIAVGLLSLLTLSTGSRLPSETVELHGAQVELSTLEELGPAELVRQVAAAGANTIILRVFDYEDEPNPGVHFQTDFAPVKDDLLGDLLVQAHLAGLHVFAWMTSLNLDEGNPTAEGWEWIEWKARRLMEVAGQLMEAVKGVNPEIKIGLDAYGETLLEPEKGRIWFAQDAQLALESKFDYLIVMSYHRSLAKEYGLTIE